MRSFASSWWHGASVTLALAGLTACTPAPAPAIDAGPTPTDAPRTYLAEPFAPTDATRAYCQGDDDAIESRITEALSSLTVDEKARMLAGATAGLVDHAWEVPGNARLGLPGLHMLDGPRGVSAFTRLRATAFPVGAMRGATWDPALERRVGQAMARELRAVGGDVLLAPTINVLRHPRWGRAQETYGEDTHHLGAMAVAFVEGVQSEGVLASAKHFAANSLEDTRHRVDVRMDERTLREVYLPHFRRVVTEAHVASVMSAYNRVNGAWCDQSAHLLTEILRDEWGFAGFVESDWYLGTHGDVDSLRAGLDLEMPSASEFRDLPRLVASGALDERELDRALRRVLRAQLCFGLDTRARTLDDAAARETPAHLALAREVARRGVVLLRNATLATGGAALPLGTDVRRVVVLGRNADRENIGDTGSSAVLPTVVVTALEGLVARAGAAVEIVHVPGATLDDAAQRTVADADAVLVVTGLTSAEEGEGEIGAGDRDSLALPPEEVALIRAAAAVHERVLVVVEGGSAVTVGAFEDEVEALLFAFYPGSEGGHALAELLFGDASPSGRLPFSIPANEADLPPFDATSDTVEYGYLHGYRHLASNGVAPAHAFGSGLSYTTFTLSDLRVSAATLTPGATVELTVHVANTGERAATETVQVYVAALGSTVPRAALDLRAFAQAALEPGAAADVTLPLRADDLAYYDVTRGAFVLEAIEYELRVGTSAASTPLLARVRAE